MGEVTEATETAEAGPTGAQAATETSENETVQGPGQESAGTGTTAAETTHPGGRSHLHLLSGGEATGASSQIRTCRLSWMGVVHQHHVLLHDVLQCMLSECFKRI